jgi:hypothetical protein
MTIHRRSNRQYVAMTDDELWQFLAEQKVMLFSFVLGDGYPHLSPIWYVTMDHVIYFRATSNKVKATVTDGAKVCCAVEQGEKFTDLRGAIIWGRARVIRDQHLIERYNVLAREKYTGLSSADLSVPEEWARQREEDPYTFIAVAPERLSSWDNRKLNSWTA